MCLNDVDITLEAGYTKPICSITMKEKIELTNVVLRHYTLYRNKAVLDQLKDGLGVLGVAKPMSQYGNILKPLFVGGMQPPLTVGK